MYRFRSWELKQEEKDKDCPVVAMVNGKVLQVFD